MAENDQVVYEAIAREAIEHALGRTFENPEAVPRRDAFIRDATDLLARFVAARCGNPGFHSARFFDAVIALSNARSRIRDAARRSRVVERLVEAERRVRSLETALRDRNEQLVQASRGDVGTLARALQEADQRIRTLEGELGDARNELANLRAQQATGGGDGPRATTLLDRLDADEIFADTAEGATRSESGRGRVMDPTPLTPARAMSGPEPGQGDGPSRRPERAELVLEPERRLAEARAERDELVQEMNKLRAHREQVELERDALQAQMTQLVQREQGIRDSKVAIGRERDTLLLRVQEIERELAARSGELDVAFRARTAVERDLDESHRGRLALAELKRSAEQELALARGERDTARSELAAKDAERARAEVAAARADEARIVAEERAAREATTAARTRRERDDLRLERDRLKDRAVPLEATRAVHEGLVASLGVAADASLATLHESLARRLELVLVHEPPEWDRLAADLTRASEDSPVAALARRRLEGLPALRDRYEKALVRATETGDTRAVLEVARALVEHERDLDLLELVAAPR